MIDECPLTELPPAQCACPNHRGGDLPDVQTVGQPFEATYEGYCCRCERRIRPGDQIARTFDGPHYVHAGRCPR